MRRFFACLVVCAAGCGDNLSVPDLGPDGPAQDLADLSIPQDLTDATVPRDLTDATIPPDLTDIAIPQDLTDATVPPDLTDIAVPPDLTDIAVPPDLTDAGPPPDLARDILGSPLKIALAQGAGPYFLVTSDIDKNGTPDFVVSDYSLGLMYVVLGKGNGQFAAPVSYQAGVLGQGQTTTFPKGIALGDFNKDQFTDLAVATTNGLLILLGKAGGTFTAPGTTYAGGLRPRTVAVADFNADGNLDVAMTNNGSNNVQIFQGSAQGTFGQPISFAVGTTPVGMTSGDFNGDGRADLAVNCADDAKGGKFGVVAVLIGQAPNNGNTSFANAAFLAVGNNPQYGVGVADINGDGKLDILASAADNSLSFLKGDGQGGFAAAVTTPNAGLTPNSLAIADFDGDKKLDVVTANSGGSNASVLLGNGDGTFKAAMVIDTPDNPQAVVAGLFDTDNKNDVAIACFNTSELVLLFNNW